ncbi:helix-turn-helix transcriptional regulator [Candidatus Kuenenbacteria bacterium]|nr:helix-turn-helix transcriptional regulator [Candidatus Kuenenbacteria bacterium]
MTTLSKIFKFLELSIKAQLVYELMIQRGPISASLISKELSMPRATVYFELDQLRKHDLVGFIGSHRKRRFIVENPNHLLGVFEQKSKQINEFIPDIKETIQNLNLQIQKASWKIPHIKFYRGKDGLKKVLSNTNKCKSKLILGINPVYDLHKAVGEKFLLKLITERVKKKIRVKNIWPADEKVPAFLKKHQEHLRNVRFSNKQKKLRSAIIVYDDVVVQITSAKELLSIEIKSQDLADSMRLMFEMMWDGSEGPLPLT